MKCLVALFDQKACIYMDPWTARTEIEAERQFRDSIADPNNGMLHRHPEDYSLVLVAYLDEFSGKVEVPDLGPKRILDGLSLVHPPATENIAHGS